MPSETVPLSADALPEASAGYQIEPVIIIFDSKPRQRRQKHDRESRRPSVAVSRKAFAFVNNFLPGKADEESRRLVKTHAMQDVLRRKSGGGNRKPKSPQSLCLSRESPPFVNSTPQAPLSDLFTFPIKIEPYMLRLVHDYASAMLPAESKVVDSVWFPLIMTDAALFHALLCTSALFAVHDIMLQRKHMIESIRLINGRLTGDGATSDTTITTILFMAKAEYFQRNHSAWSVHMDGVIRVVELRGGLGMLPQSVQDKIHSTDLLGCMEFGAIPHFPIANLQKPSLPSYLLDLPPAIFSLAEDYALDPDLMALLSEITTHTSSLPATLDNYSLQYRLLSLRSSHQHHYLSSSFSILNTPFCSQDQQAQSKIVQELLITGAVLFLSLPHTRALPPFRSVDYGYLLNCLSSLISPLFNGQALLQHPEFLLWLSFLGEIFSSTSSPLFTCARERSPFRLQLRTSSTMLRILSWEDMMTALSAMWAFEPGHDKPYRHLWEGVMTGHEI